jgi:hypothetical protein
LNLTTIKNRITNTFYSIIPETLKDKTSTVIIWILFGLIIRLVLMPLFAHADFTTTMWISFTLADKHQLIASADPPAIFLVLGGFYSTVFSLFSGNFTSLLTSNISFTPPAILPTLALVQPGINSALLIGKIPYLILDLASAIFLLNFFNDGKKGLLAMKLWLLCPVSIFISYMVGQYDIFAVSFIIMSLYCLKKNKFGWCMLFLGLAGAFKIIGLALIPFVLLFFWNSNKDKLLLQKIFTTVKYLAIGLLPFVIFPIASLIPQYYESVNAALPIGTMYNGFFGSVFYSRGMVGQPFLSGLISFIINYSISIQTQQVIQDVLYFIPLIFTGLLLVAIYSKELSINRIIRLFTIFLLAYYASTLFLPQWFMWIQPFLILLAVQNRAFLKLYLLLIPFYFIYIWYWDAELTVKILAPTISQSLFWTGPLTFMNNIGLPGMQIINISRTIFSAICLFTIFYILKDSFSIFSWQKNKTEIDKKPFIPT